jgi:hypothetical protein
MPESWLEYANRRMEEEMHKAIEEKWEPLNSDLTEEEWAIVHHVLAHFSITVAMLYFQTPPKLAPRVNEIMADTLQISVKVNREIEERLMSGELTR